MASKSAEVTCDHCGKILGDQYKPGDGLRLFQAHLKATKNHTLCDACSTGDHSYHSSPSLAHICIGCACEWKPASAGDAA